MDTNIFSGLLSGEDAAIAMTQPALEEARAKGILAASPAVYAELVAGRTPEIVDTFFADKGIEVDWNIGR